jgi:hypothetical protein
VEVGATYMSEDWGQVMMPFGEFIDTHIMGTRSHHSCRGGARVAVVYPARVLHRCFCCMLSAYLAQHPLFDQIPELRKDIMVPDYCCLREREDVDETDTEVWRLDVLVVSRRIVSLSWCRFVSTRGLAETRSVAITQTRYTTCCVR